MKEEESKGRAELIDVSKVMERGSRSLDLRPLSQAQAQLLLACNFPPFPFLDLEPHWHWSRELTAVLLIRLAPLPVWGSLG